MSFQLQWIQDAAALLKQARVAAPSKATPSGSVWALNDAWCRRVDELLTPHTAREPLVSSFTHDTE
jgi:hypothetical protein